MGGSWVGEHPEASQLHWAFLAPSSFGSCPPLVVLVPPSPRSLNVPVLFQLFSEATNIFFY